MSDVIGFINHVLADLESEPMPVESLERIIGGCLELLLSDSHSRLEDVTIDYLMNLFSVTLAAYQDLPAIDIKPGSDPNSINLCSNGAVPVAIFGSATLDVSNVNTENLRFAEAAVKVVGKKDPNQLCGYQDINGDFISDLVCHFVTTDIAGIDGESTTATVNGELFDGTPIEGTDSVNIVKDTCN